MEQKSLNLMQLKTSTNLNTIAQQHNAKLVVDNTNTK